MRWLFANEVFLEHFMVAWWKLFQNIRILLQSLNVPHEDPFFTAAQSFSARFYCSKCSFSLVVNVMFSFRFSLCLPPHLYALCPHSPSEKLNSTWSERDFSPLSNVAGPNEAAERLEKGISGCLTRQSQSNGFAWEATRDSWRIAPKIKNGSLMRKTFRLEDPSMKRQSNTINGSEALKWFAKSTWNQVMVKYFRHNLLDVAKNVIFIFSSWYLTNRQIDITS